MCHGQMLDQAIRKARKEHRCDDCGRTIKAGERYERQAHKDSGAIETWVGCRECSIRNAAFWELEEYGQDSCYIDRGAILREHAIGGGWRRVLAALRRARERWRLPA